MKMAQYATLLRPTKLGGYSVMASAGITRRNVLYVATGAVGAAGFGFAAWPLIDQMNPDASVIAAGDFVELDLTKLLPGHSQMLRWHFLPIVVVKRAPEALKILQESKHVSRLVDPDSHDDQQPAYAKNWHRSLHPDYSILVYVCTYCGCVPQYLPDDRVVQFEGAGGHFCPCCASKYDLAGRAYLGTIARHNLPIPPHSFVDEKTLRIGQNPPGEIFYFEAIRQI
jgi:ubiquinol-cytochrome c reductase iron-sulfur subunit